MITRPSNYVIHATRHTLYTRPLLTPEASFEFFDLFHTPFYSAVPNVYTQRLLGLSWNVEAKGVNVS